LGKVEVQAKIKILKEERNKRTGVKADDVVRELAAIGFSNIANCFDKDGMPKSLEDMPTEVVLYLKPRLMRHFKRLSATIDI